MEAKEMSDTEIEQFMVHLCANPALLLRLVEHIQAISFKAGEKQGIRKAIDNLKMHHCIVDVEARIKEIENDRPKRMATEQSRGSSTRENRS